MGIYLYLFSGVVILVMIPWAVTLDTATVRSKRVWVIPIILRIRIPVPKNKKKMYVRKVSAKNKE